MRRREVLQAIAAIPAATWLLGCGHAATTHHARRHPDASSAVFEATSTGFLVWVWAKSGGAAIVRTAGIDHPVALDPASGIGVTAIDGLASGTAFDVDVALADGTAVGRHRIETAPAPSQAVPVRFAVSADYDPSGHRFESQVLDGTIARNPAFFVSLGDFPYVDNGPIPEDLDGFRRRHLDARTHPPIVALHQACGCYAIYDDHEFTNNWDAVRVARDPIRYGEAVRAWDEFFPLRDRAGEVRYRSWRWGALLECFLLDCRRFRSADTAPDGPDKTMLGATQLAWFKAAIASSTATWKLVFTTIPLGYTADNNDDWTSFAVERQQLFDHLVAAKVTGVLFVSGDQHWFASQVHEYGIREFQVGPLRRGLGKPPRAVPGVTYRFVDMNAGIVDVTPDKLTMSGVGPDGDVFYTEAMTLADLTPRRGQDG